MKRNAVIRARTALKRASWIRMVIVEEMADGHEG